MTRERWLLLAFVTVAMIADFLPHPSSSPTPVAVAATAPADPATIPVPEPSTTASPSSTTAPPSTLFGGPRARTTVSPGSAVDHPPVPASTPPVEAHVAGGSGTFTVTCYTETGTTASGRAAGPGGVAVDPSLIPMGSAVHVDGLGTFRADDTGGDIRGYRLDIWMSSYSACVQFGRQVRHAEW